MELSLWIGISQNRGALVGPSRRPSSAQQVEQQGVCHFVSQRCELLFRVGKQIDAFSRRALVAPDRAGPFSLNRPASGSSKVAGLATMDDNGAGQRPVVELVRTTPELSESIAHILALLSDPGSVVMAAIVPYCKVRSCCLPS